MKKYIIYLSVSLLLMSCNSWKTQIISNGDLDNINQNIAIDFYNTHKKSKNKKAFSINQLEESNNLYVFYVNEISKEYVHIHDSIGSISNDFFYKNYHKEKNALFLWTVAGKETTKELINEMNKFNIIDSTYIKIANGDLSEDNVPVRVNDDSKKATFYYVCKDNISKYKKTKSNKVLSVENYPKVNCN